MKSKLLILTFGILLISLTSAIYPGETQVFPNDLGKTNLVWTIIENTSEISVLPIITIDVSNITISIPPETPPQSFKLVFMEETTTTVVQTVTVSSGGGGGGTRTITKYVNQTVEVDNYVSVPVDNKTIEYQNNTITKWETTKEITGWTWFLAIGILLVILIFLYFAWRLSNKYNSEGGQEENE